MQYKSYTFENEQMHHSSNNAHVLGIGQQGARAFGEGACICWLFMRALMRHEIYSHFSPSEAVKHAVFAPWGYEHSR